MTTKRWGSSALAAAGVAALLIAATPTVAAPPAAAPTPQAGPFGRIARCFRILDLTDAQRADIGSVLEAARPEAEALHATFETDRAAMKAALEKTPPDPCEVGAAALALKADREARRALFDRVKTDVLAVLTPAQQAKLAGCLEAPKDAPPPSAEAGPEE
jgi:Spy/CpxP family protein refolding chaperone